MIDYKSFFFKRKRNIDFIFFSSLLVFSTAFVHTHKFLNVYDISLLREHEERIIVVLISCCHWGEQ